MTAPAAARVPLYGTAPDGPLTELYERMRREHGAVIPVDISPGVGAWLVIGHRELLHLVRDEQYFSHDPRRWTRCATAGCRPPTARCSPSWARWPRPGRPPPVTI
ncbi:hypothetical protein ABZS86_14565 [Streptomyces sp. NPDC005355]|uniref:hypothetical protein n=1 Tax=Streptomyces sp. NPDC005355 TaxID=3157038 RepID=UPI0033B998B6